MKTILIAMTFAVLSSTAWLVTPASAAGLCNVPNPPPICDGSGEPPLPPPPVVQTVDVPNQLLSSVAVLPIATAGHLAGNVELTTTVAMPHSLSCEKFHVTTKRSLDPNRDMFLILKGALEKRKPVQLRITNDPAKTAYPGRCSLVAVQVN